MFATEIEENKQTLRCSEHSGCATEVATFLKLLLREYEYLIAPDVYIYLTQLLFDDNDSAGHYNSQ